jgi:hypothetical protein
VENHEVLSEAKSLDVHSTQVSAPQKLFPLQSGLTNKAKSLDKKTASLQSNHNPAPSTRTGFVASRRRKHSTEWFFATSSNKQLKTINQLV